VHRLAYIALVAPLLFTCRATQPASSSSSLNSTGAAGCLPVESSSDWPSLLLLARAANIAYGDANSIEQSAKSWGFSQLSVLSQGSMSAFVASNSGCVLLAFRGTDDIRDWFTNAQVHQRLVTHGRIHTGFHGAYQALRGKVRQALAQHGAATKSLWVTGHSLGGALAGAFAYDESKGLAAQNIEIEKLATFGQPMLANVKLAKYLRSSYVGRYFRVVNERDIVARSPPIPAGYEHFGTLVWFHDGIVERYEEQALMMGNPGGDLPQVEPAEIPAALSPNQAEFDAFMQGDDDLTNDEPVFEDSDGTQPLYGGNIGVQDHSMTYYIEKIAGQL
jgi:triacylglycerol lipase